MKKIISLLLLSFFVLNSFGQIIKKAVIQDFTPGFSEYDTVLVLGAISSKGKTKYFVQSLEAGVLERTFVPERKIEFLPDTLNFWENIWFTTSIYNYKLERKKYILNSDKEEKLLNYLGELEGNNKFYDDPYVEDYVSQIIYKIYPEKITLENKNITIIPKLINDPKTKIQPLANGFLLIGIDFLAKQKSEEEFIDEVIKGMAHIILRHGTLNINQDYYGSNPYGSNFSTYQSKTAEKIAKDFVASKKNDSTNLSYFLSEKGFLTKISGIINYIAWQEYYSNHIENSTRLLDKLIDNDLAVEETYFLKAKILRQSNNDYASNVQALELLQKAEKNPLHGYMEIYKEKGLIFLRLGKTDKAVEAFQQYKVALSQQEVTDPIKLKWCNYMLHRCSEELNQTAKLH